jgi:hypothetical protein
VPVNSTHSEYDANFPGWLRARDVFAGEDMQARRRRKSICRGWVVRKTRNFSPAKTGLVFQRFRPHGGCFWG